MKITTKFLLACGIVASVSFQVVVIIQMLTRKGFDPTRHPLSMLSLGDLGWIQITNFIFCGILFIAAAKGVKQSLQSGPGRTWIPRLITLYGVGPVIGGIFRVDPMLGFPPGTPNTIPTVMSPYAIVHNLSFFVIFIALLVTQFVFVRRFFVLKQRAWAVYSLLTGIIVPLIIIAGSSTLPVKADLLFGAGLVSAIWLTAIFTKFFVEYKKQ